MLLQEVQQTKSGANGDARLLQIGVNGTKKKKTTRSWAPTSMKSSEQADQ